MDLFSPKHLLIVLLVVLLVFGTKKLRTIGSDLGQAVKGFKDSMKEGEKEQSASTPVEPAQIPAAPASQAHDPAAATQQPHDKTAA